MALVEIGNLTVEARDGRAWRPIVNNVSLSVDRGEAVGLIGESGAGKSTVGLAAMGYVRRGCRVACGTLRYGEAELQEASESALQRLRGSRITYVAQSASASFNPAHRIGSQCCESAIRKGEMSRSEAQAQLRGLFERMRLPPFEQFSRRYPHQVSGGQLQRAMIAMAMLPSPELIIFDEPTTALDVTTQLEVLAAIREAIADSKTACIYITHDLAVVSQLVDRIKILRHGSEVEEGETGKVLSFPSTEYAQALLQARRFSRPAAVADEAAEAPVLEIRNIVAGYGNQPVLKDVGLRVFSSQTVALVGESGSGKSTLARVAAGLHVPDTGEIVLHGSALAPHYAQRSKEDRRRIQFVYQSADTALNPRMPVHEIVGYPARFFHDLKGRALAERVSDLLATVGLEPGKYSDRRPTQLSGGEKQRVGLARALAGEPQVLICDEITSALDVVVADEILQLLDSLRKSLGLCCLFITHDFVTVRAIADRVVVLQDGRVRERGSREDIFERPTHRYTRRLLDSVPTTEPGWLDRHIAMRTTIDEETIDEDD